MRRAGLTLWLLTLLLSVLLSSHIYASGFFLTRYELRNKSTSSPLPPQFRQAVLLLIDALRFDFANYTSTSADKNYANRLPVLHTMLTTQPANSRLFRFVADPPTVTMQRIKGLMTGSLPTFIDFKDNFHSNAIEEDSVIWQCKEHGYRTFFAGDDTWLGLFPSDFSSIHPFDSFNVKDLDTVDQGVMHHLPSALTQGNYSLLIGHMLGVDHVGHRYYSNHPEMARKLGEINGFIEKLIEMLPEESVLLVFGDHGMTEDGNHGGTSEMETDSALFAYSKKPFSSEISVQRNSLFQIDLVPTLSLLLGLPIPFNNLGSPIVELFREKELVLPGLYATAEQVYTYINTYNTHIQHLPDRQFEDLQDSFSLLTSHYTSSSPPPDLLPRLSSFIKSAADMCRGIWTTFDLDSMRLGMALFLSITAVAAFVALKTPLFDHIFLIICCLSLLIMTIFGLFWSLLIIIIAVFLSKKQENKLTNILENAVIQVCHSYCLFSNSYIVAEDSSVRFLLQITLFYCYFTSNNRQKEWKKYLLCAVLVRFTAALDPINQKTNLDLFDRFFMLNIVRFYTPLSIFMWILYKSDLKIPRKIVILLNFILVGAYFCLQDTIYSEYIKLTLPRVIYLLSICTCLTRNPQNLYFSLQPLLNLLGGVEFPIVFLVISVQIRVFKELMKGRKSALWPVFVYLTVWEMFYSTGHRCSFPSLQIASAFVGFETFNYYISGLLLVINTCSCLVVLVAGDVAEDGEVSLHVAECWVVGLGMTTGNTYVNRRHLMVWPIFAPKYIFDVGMTGIGLGVMAGLAAVRERDREKGEREQGKTQ